jgi:hypothetical protein
MFRTPLIAALTVALLGGTAMAQPANAPPNTLSNSARSAPDYDEEEGLGSPPSEAQSIYAQRDADERARDSRARDSQAQDRDMFCRRDAAARTGYATPREAARDEQTRGTIGGTLGGAALGAIIGAGAGNAGLGAAAGAGAGLIAGTAIGADNARHAARDVEADYADAYYGCMHEDSRQAAYDAPPPGYGYGPPSDYYYPRPYGYYPYSYYGPSYGPSLSFGFGFGGGRGWGGGHGWGGGRGFHGGRHH